MTLYLDQSKSEDSTIRNTVSESIGKLFFTEHSSLTGIIMAAFKSGNNNTISTFARSFKYSAFKNPNTIHFSPLIKVIIDALNVNHVEVKQNVLQALLQFVLNPDLKNLVGAHVNELVTQLVQ